MSIQLIQDSIVVDQLKELAQAGYGDLIKAVVDVERKIMAIGGQMHVDEEQFLLEKGSKQGDVWGINIYPDKKGTAMIEFDSMINIRPRQNNNSRYVEDKSLRQKILSIVKKTIK